MTISQQESVLISLDEQALLIARLAHEQHQARVVLEDLEWRWDQERQLLVAPTDTSLAATVMIAVAELQGQGIPTALEPSSGAPRSDAERVFQQLIEVRGQPSSSPEPEEPTAQLRGGGLSYAQRYGTASQQPDVDPGGHTIPL
ncbi:MULTISPECIES: hypothetical protein [Streptacidiphilus]|uniref:Uncharacterized protein n=1 Tax=Streptacidiphilus cavernicola TaxID=3342716 RepID=A0ABV6UP43_9ACTN|nr:hypothetical protein [Streptacidiphilus jeojiense]